MKTCARCGLVSPDSSLGCECGFSLASSNRRAAAREHAVQRAAARNRMIIGAALAIFATIGTIVGYLAATQRGGGYYTVWIGGVVAGATMFMRGWGKRLAIREAEATPSDPDQDQPKEPKP